MSRRTALKSLGAVPVAAGLTWTPAEAEHAHGQAVTARRTAAASKVAFKPAFFTAHEWATVRVLVDLIIPRDARSGSATEAGVPEFMDFMMVDQSARQTAMRGGLKWTDTEALRRFGKTFLDATPADRTSLLDDLAWPAKSRPELSQGVAFFSAFRDLTASGFWSSRMGIDDLKYIGNVANPDWQGCPAAALEKLGLKG